jgi:hypothetical protein
MIAGALVVAVPDAHLLLAVCRADRSGGGASRRGESCSIALWR